MAGTVGYEDEGEFGMTVSLGSFSLEDKVAVVSAAGRGIGQGIARGYGALGAKLLLADIDEDGVSATAAELAASGIEAIPYVGNLTKAQAVAGMIDAAMDRFGRIDILANVVGGLSLKDRGPVMELEEQSWDGIIELNLKSVFLASKLGAAKMIASDRGGSIVNIGSISGINRNPRGSHYGAAKAAVMHFTKTLAHELAPSAIRVNAIAPGVIDTPMNREARAFMKLGDAELAQSIPLQRLGTVDDVASAAIFFASDASNYVTGQILIVGGGLEVWGK